MHSAWFRSTFPRVFKFLQLKEWGSNFWGNQFCKISELLGLPFLDANSWSFIRFQCILHDWGVHFSESSNFYKLKRWEYNFWGKQFCGKSGLFGLPFCILILKVLWTQMFDHSLDCKAFWMIQEYFFSVFKFLQIKETGPNFWGEPILENVWIIWSLLLYFDFKSLLESVFSSFIRFQCILHGSGKLFSECSKFYELKSGDLISGENQFCRRSELFGSLLCISILKVF